MRLIVFVIFLSVILSAVVSATPVVLFSDLTSAPNNGWSDLEPNKGAAVTIWGYGFGENRGSSYVRVNGVEINSSDYYVWGENWPTRYWQKITFRLNDNIPVGSQGIEVVVNGEVSNSLNFR